MNTIESIRQYGLIADRAYRDDPVSSTIDIDGIKYKVKETQDTIQGTENSSSGFQAMLLENINNGKYVIAFRGTELDQGWAEGWKDLFLNDFIMGLGDAPDQFKDALIFVKEIFSKYGEISTSNTTLTGHSLGGSLAVLCSYVYNFSTKGGRCGLYTLYDSLPYAGRESSPQSKRSLAKPMPINFGPMP